MKKIYNRKLKNLNNKTGEKIKRTIQEIIDNKEKYKNCYFWNPPMTAVQRREKEFEIILEFFLDNKKYQIRQKMALSCKNYYFKTTILIDNIQKNITSIKKLI